MIVSWNLWEKDKRILEKTYSTSVLEDPQGIRQSTWYSEDYNDLSEVIPTVKEFCQVTGLSDT